MRKNVFNVALGFCLLTAVAATTAFAQDLPGPFERANIPFAFSLRGKAFPAGDYEIKRVRDDMPNLLIISNLDNRHQRAIFETENVDAKLIPNRGELIFHRYGNSYFLSEVFASGEQRGLELRPSRQERTLRREMAINGTSAETITVAAL